MRIFALAFLFVIPAIQAALIDEIAITVGNQAITASEIDQEIRLSSLLNSKPPELSLEARRDAADRLIEQALIRREMSFGSYPRIPIAQVDQAIANTEQAHGGAAQLDTLLMRDRLTRKELHDYLQWQLTLLKFIDLRFRPAVQVSDEDVATYIKEHVAVKPAPDGSTPGLRELHDQIEQKLTAERVDTQLDDWIKRSRARTTVRYLNVTLARPEGAPSTQ